MKVNTHQIVPNPLQPRNARDVAAAAEALQPSLAEHGLINPVAVEPLQDGTYRLIDGECRWRAAVALGWETIEVHIREDVQSDDGLLELALVGNTHRNGMSLLDEARACKRLSESGMTLSKIAPLLGWKTANPVAVRLSILEFEHDIQNLFDTGALPVHAQVINAIGSLPPSERVRWARTFANRKFSVAKIISTCEKLLRGNAPTQSAKPGRPASTNAPERWNAARQVAQEGVTLTDDLDKAAQHTCQRCPLAESASSGVCADCPAVDLLKYLAREVSK